MRELNESELVEMAKEMTDSVSRVFTVLELDKERAMKYKNILSRNGYKTDVKKSESGLSSAISGFFDGYDSKYQLTVRKIKTAEAPIYD